MISKAGGTLFCTFIITMLCFSQSAFCAEYAPDSTGAFVVAQKTKKSSKKSKNKENDFTIQEETIVTIPSVAKEHSYFSSVNKDILDLIYNGTPEDLKTAAYKLHKSVTEEYTEQEKLLTYVCASIVQIVWKSEKVTWDVPQINFTNQYIGAVESAKKGIYDLSTNNSDFLSAILPVLVLAEDNNNSEYHELAEAAIKRALELNNTSVLANYLGGILASQKEDNDLALEYFTKCYNSSTNILEVVTEYSRFNFICGNYTQALSTAEKTLDRFPQNPELLKLCAKSSYYIEQYAKAENYIVRVLLLEPDNTEYVLLRARILIRNSDFIRAASLLDVCARINPNTKDYLLLRAELQRDWNKNLIAATQTINQTLSLYPDDPDVILMAAEISSASGNKINGLTAMELINKVMENDSDNVFAAKICIKELIKEKKYEEAYKLSKKLVSQENVLKETKITHIEICTNAKRTEEAFSIASELYKNTPQDELVQQIYLKVLVSLNRKTEAMSIINSLISGANSKMKSFLFYQKSFFESTEEAMLSDLRSSLTSNPRNEEALYKLYQVYYNKSDWRRAQYYLKQVVALDPTNTEYLLKNSELDRLLH